MDPLTIGILVAGVGALSGWVDYLSSAKRKQEDIIDERERQNESYRLQKEEAALEYEKAKKEANRNAQKANLQADLTDQSLDIGERTLSNDINTAIDNLYLSQASDTYEWNQQAMSNGAGTGASYASLASSGVRAGSSLSDAVEMQAATNSELLQFAQDSKRRSDNNNLGSVLNQLAGNEFNILQGRIGASETRKDALDLVNSYLKGGSNYNIYQNQLEQMKSSYTYNQKQLKKEMDKTNPLGIDFWLGAGSAILGGGASGFQTGYNVGDTYYRGKSYTTTLDNKK